VTAPVVADGRADRLRHAVDPLHQVLETLRRELRRHLDRRVQIGDVRVVMFSVMNLHRHLVDVRFERIRGIRESGQCKSHRAILRAKRQASSLYAGRPQGLHYLMESMRSSATLVQCFWPSGTTMRL